MSERAVIQESLQRFLDADVATDEWDVQPSLVLIVQEKGGPPQFAPVPIDDESWGAAEPYRVVRVAADAARIVHQRTGWSPFEPGQVLLGVALFTEGWSVTEQDAATARILQAWMGEGHRLSEHPLSIEVKLITAILQDDEPIMLVHARGGVPMPDTTAGATEGRVPEALQYVLDAFQALTIRGDA